MRDRGPITDIAIRIAADIAAGLIIGAVLLITLAAAAYSISTVHRVAGWSTGVSK